MAAGLPVQLQVVTTRSSLLGHRLEACKSNLHRALRLILKETSQPLQAFNRAAFHPFDDVLSWLDVVDKTDRCS